MRLLMVICLSFFASQVQALEIEKLFMPGDVISGHQKLETECTNCHVRLRDTTQRLLCLDCHEDVDKDIQQARGFHGLDKKASTIDCNVCHTDHEGRDANIIRLDEDSFDHAVTDFILRGKHLQTRCQQCHLPEKKFTEAGSNCIDCHKKDDVHDKKLGSQCGDCHNAKDWRNKKFDHDKTDFRLSGSHRQVSCDSCHVGSQFENTPKTCIACHAIKDIHQNRFGQRCQSCHKQTKWHQTTFDHNQISRFKLKDKHSEQTCKACHSKRKPVAIDKNKKPRTCYSCHRLDDIHKGSNGKQCQECHQVKSWLDSEFDHDTKTDFPLLGAHQKVPCQVCHLDDAESKKIDTDCYSCHRQDDSHNQQEGKKCGQCHRTSSWLSEVRFDHDLSLFPLIGQHAVIACESCHASSKFKDAETACVSCHQSQDVHKAALGDNCQDCHNANDWLLWDFDHAQTGFEIMGSHENLHCHQCHLKSGTGKKSSNACVDCHRADDIHKGNFGSDCARCHQQDDFSTINLRSLNQSQLKKLN